MAVGFLLSLQDGLICAQALPAAAGDNLARPSVALAAGASKARADVATYATVGTDGSSARVDVVDGGDPDSLARIDVAKRNFLAAISLPGGTDLDDDLTDLPGSGALNATGFDEYGTGLDAGAHAGRGHRLRRHHRRGPPQ